jgi:hypothetical protein
MIAQPDPLTTTVQFGKDGVGAVGLTVGVETVNMIATSGRLTIQQLVSGDFKIGKPFDPVKDITELPKIDLNFTDLASVDAMIDCLKHLRYKMEYPMPIYCYCA